ncbi:MAG TPA: hypothetical protein VIZ00_10065 [Streptosporangiaceae bacterium]
MLAGSQAPDGRGVAALGPGQDDRVAGQVSGIGQEDGRSQRELR